MRRQWTIGQKIVAGMSALTIVTLLISAIAILALNQVVSSKDQVIEREARTLIDSKALSATFEAKTSAGRAYVFTLQQSHLDEMQKRREVFAAELQQLRRNVYTEEGDRFVEELKRLEQAHAAAFNEVIQLRRSNADIDTVIAQFDKDTVPLSNKISSLQEAFDTLKEQALHQAVKDSTRSANIAVTEVVTMAVIGVIAATLIAVLLSRGLTRQIGTAIHHIQTSSTQLQSATTEQAAGTKEQTSAIAEVSATLKELVSTARQMMENAQSVARVAEQAAGSARNGDITVQRAQDAIIVIKKQVDLIVGHMLDLGKKSQQIGSILEIINELAEQTNILAINATIEAAGAGENGRRFAVVADEIRKLADRVGGSSKDIRILIDEIRAAANTTVMATEDGSKAVDAGTQQFDEVARLFRQIGTTVESTTDASREIELGTKQQVSAVEQVNTALTGVAQAAKDAETTTRQTLETATQLAQLSQNLSQLVQAHSVA